MTAVIILFIAFILIVMNIIVGRLRTTENERIVYKMDKVVTLTGGLENDRINERIYERNPDTGKIRSRKSGDYDNLVDEELRVNDIKNKKK